MLDLEQYRAILENAPNLLWRAGLDKTCDYFNKTWLNFTGRSMDQECGDGWVEGVHPEDLQRCIQIYSDSFDLRVPFEMEYRLRRADGEYRWINDRGTPFYTDGGEFSGYIGSCMDVTERIEGAMLKERAHKDGLTGLLSRTRFDELAVKELERAQRYRTALCLVMADIDGFKEVNDTHGHLAGDQVLLAFSNFLRTHMRPFDFIARYGGDEFILLIPDTDVSQAGSLISRLQKELVDFRADVAGKPYAIRTSFGLAALMPGDSLGAIVERADKAMYAAKSGGLPEGV